MWHKPTSASTEFIFRALDSRAVGISHTLTCMLPLKCCAIRLFSQRRVLGITNLDHCRGPPTGISRGADAFCTDFSRGPARMCVSVSGNPPGTFAIPPNGRIRARVCRGIGSVSRYGGRRRAVTRRPRRFVSASATCRRLARLCRRPRRGSCRLSPRGA